MGIQKLEVLGGATSSPIWNSPFTMKLIVFSALLAMALAMPEPGYEAAPKGDARRYWGKRSAEEPGYEAASKGDARRYWGKRSAEEPVVDARRFQRSVNAGPPQGGIGYRSADSGSQYGIIGKRSADSEEPGYP